MSTLEVCYLLVDDRQNPVSQCFTVELPLGARAGDLVKKIKEDDPDLPAARYLKVWKVTEPRSVAELEAGDNTMLAYIRGIRLLKNTNHERADAALFLSATARLSPDGTALEADKLHFLVQMPATPGMS